MNKHMHEKANTLKDKNILQTSEKIKGDSTREAKLIDTTFNNYLEESETKIGKIPGQANLNSNISIHPFIIFTWLRL
jgi:hypothetical protein